MRCDFVNYDDDIYVTQNQHVQGGLTRENVKWAFLNPINCNWEPLTELTHMADCQIYGLRPWGHHLTSVLFHAMNAALVFVLLRQLSGASWRSFLAAVIFAVHPLHVESVAWVSERKDVLSGFCGLLSLCFYVRYATKSGIGDYFLALSFLALGLMSKAMLVTWPFVMLLLDYWPLNRIQGFALFRQSSSARKSKPLRFRRLLIEKIPFFALVVAAMFIAVVAQKQEGALKDLKSLPLDARCGNAVVSYCRYVGKLFWPTDLAVIYPHPGYWKIGQVLFAGAFLLVISILFLVMRRRYPFLLIGWLWFIGTLLPVIQLVQMGGIAMADRYAYLPSLGILLVAIWGATELAGSRWRNGYLALFAAISVVIVLFMAVCRNQLVYWQNSEALFRHTVEVTQLNPIAQDNLGFALLTQGKFDEAIGHFQEAIRLVPEFVEAHMSLGSALASKGQGDKATREFQETVRLKPDWAEAHYNLGLMLKGNGQIEEAIRQFQEVIRLEPNNADAYNDLGNALDHNGQTDEALRQYQEAIRLKPDGAEAHSNLGAAFGKKGDVDGAIRELQEALRLNPNDVLTRYNLGTALHQKGRTNEAILQLQAALRMNPDFVEARNLMSKLEMTNAPAGR
jgi:tetratricopeptide (TPR) repeat protein